MTYKGYPVYMPMVGNLAENGLVVGDEFREGNESPGARNLEFIKYCLSQMPGGKRVQAVRADAASYQADIINCCNQKEIEHANRVYLKVCRRLYTLFDEIRLRIWEFAQT